MPLLLYMVGHVISYGGAPYNYFSFLRSISMEDTAYQIHSIAACPIYKDQAKHETIHVRIQQFEI